MFLLHQRLMLLCLYETLHLTVIYVETLSLSESRHIQSGFTKSSRQCAFRMMKLKINIPILAFMLLSLIVIIIYISNVQNNSEPHQANALDPNFTCTFFAYKKHTEMSSNVLSQSEKYLSMNKKEKTYQQNAEANDKKDYHYKFVWYSDNTMLTILIREQYKGVATKGGSSFRILVEGNATLSLCTSQDQFDGRYIAKCNLWEDCVNVTITLLFTNFGAFQETKRSIKRRKLHSQEFCITHSKCPGRKDGLFPGILQVPGCKVNPHGHVTWIKSVDKYQYQLLVDNCKIDVERFRHLQEKFKSVYKIIFLGDSHAQFMARYVNYILNNVTGNNTLVVHAHARFITTMIASFKNKVVPELKTNPNATFLIVCNVGIWDMTVLDLQKFKQRFTVIRVGRFFQRYTKRTIRIIWQYTPAWPDRYDTTTSRNNLLIESHDNWVRNKLKPFGIDAFAVTFHATNVRNDDGDCKHHFFCAPNIGKCNEQCFSRGQHYAGMVGKPFAHALLWYVSQTSTW